MTSSPFSLLFHPLRIGPVTAPNRFYQVPHCNGFGHRLPRGQAAICACYRVDEGFAILHFVRSRVADGEGIVIRTDLGGSLL